MIVNVSVLFDYTVLQSWFSLTLESRKKRGDYNENNYIELN